MSGIDVADKSLEQAIQLIGHSKSALDFLSNPEVFEKSLKLSIASIRLARAAAETAIDALDTVESEYLGDPS